MWGRGGVGSRGECGVMGGWGVMHCQSIHQGGGGGRGSWEGLWGGCEVMGRGEAWGDVGGVWGWGGWGDGGGMWGDDVEMGGVGDLGQWEKMWGCGEGYGDGCGGVGL